MESALLALTTHYILPWALGLTLLFEAVTILFRFGFKVQATRDTAKYVARWTRGIRIHHGYWGVPLLILGVYLQTKIIMGDDAVEKKAFENSGKVSSEIIKTSFCCKGLNFIF